MDTLLEIKNLNVRYRDYNDTVCAVNGIDLHIGNRETLGLVGETGAGKTTTAMSIMRLLPQRTATATADKMEFNGMDLQKLSNRQMHDIRGSLISMVFQDPMTSLNPLMTVGEQIAEMVKLHEKLSKKELSDRVDQLMEKVGLPKERKSEFPHQFSGGMKQRVVIAIALACNPMLLIADEPTTALDVTIQAQILNMMEELKREYGTAMLLITHDLGIVAEMCDRVAIMYAGEIVETGTVEQIFSEPTHPYTIGLFQSIPNLEDTKERLTPIKGLMPDPANLPSGCKFHPRCSCASAECSTCQPEVIDLGEGHLVQCLRCQQKKEDTNHG